MLPGSEPARGLWNHCLFASFCAAGSCRPAGVNGRAGFRFVVRFPCSVGRAFTPAATLGAQRGALFCVSREEFLTNKKAQRP